MPVVTTKSAAIANRDATPPVINTAAKTDAPLRVAKGLVAVANGDSIASKFIFCSVPSNAVVSAVLLTTADVGTTGAMDIGLYRSTKDGGAVVNASFFGSAVSISGGALARSDVTHESTVYPYTNRERPLWEALGLSSDPCVDYDVVGTLTAASDAAGALLLEVEFTQ